MKKEDGTTVNGTHGAEAATVNSAQSHRAESATTGKRSFSTSAAERYDRFLERSLSRHPLPEGVTVALPQPTSKWPAENIALLERYREWLVAGGASTEVINSFRIPMAGTLLGLALKRFKEIDLITDKKKSLIYIKAKGKSEVWERNCVHSLEWFCRFLAEERGLVKAEPPRYGNVAQWQIGLPGWLLESLTRLLHIRQAGWRRSRLEQSTYRYWYIMTYVWRWLLNNELWDGEEIRTIERRHLDRFVDEMLVAGQAVKTINVTLQHFQSVLRFLEQNGMRTPHHLLVMPLLKAPDPVPRFLSDSQVEKVKTGLQERVLNAKTVTRQRDSRLDLAIFYLLWQTGMRVSELEDLALDDIFPDEKRVVIRETKGIKDRVVYLTDLAVAAVADYLTVRGPALSDHLFIYRHKALSKDIVRVRIKATGRRVGVKVTPHMLRHTFATQLLNAGCRVTSIQALLGHKRLGTTMIYARVHNETVAQDYVTAMAEIEAKSGISVAKMVPDEPKPIGGQSDLLDLLDDLSGDNLTTDQLGALIKLRQRLAEQSAEESG